MIVLTFSTIMIMFYIVVARQVEYLSHVDSSKLQRYLNIYMRIYILKNDKSKYNWVSQGYKLTIGNITYYENFGRPKTVKQAKHTNHNIIIIKFYAYAFTTRFKNPC